MKFKFPQHIIPVYISDQIVGMDDIYVENTVINGKNYRISKNRERLTITYRVNSVIDMFFLVFLQVTQAKITLDKNTSQERFCEIKIKEFIKFSWLASIVIFGLVITYLLFLEPKFGLVFLLGLILIAFIQYKIFEFAIMYIRHHIEMDLYSILNFIEQKTKPST